MIEDDQRLASMVASYLAQHGFELEHASTGQQGMQRILSGEANVVLVLLDLMLPDANGLDICRQIRSLQSPQSALPIVMLTAKGDPMDRVVGLELGADDYLPKPFEPRELLARLRAVLRRPALPDNQLANGGRNLMRFGRLCIDLDARSVKIDGQERAITAYQFDLLVAMAERAGRVLSRDLLCDAVKGEQFDVFDRSINVHIGRLRAALEDDPRQPKRIITVRGTGYVFAKVQDG